MYKKCCLIYLFVSHKAIHIFMRFWVKVHNSLWNNPRYHWCKMNFLSILKNLYIKISLIRRLISFWNLSWIWLSNMQVYSKYLPISWDENNDFSRHNLHGCFQRKGIFTLVTHGQINSLWPGDAIWQHTSGSTLAQIMACCLMASSHYLNQCWLINKGPADLSPEINFPRSAHELNGQHVFKRLHFWNYYHISQGPMSSTTDLQLTNWQSDKSWWESYPNKKWRVHIQHKITHMSTHEKIMFSSSVIKKA